MTTGKYRLNATSKTWLALVLGIILLIVPGLFLVPEQPVPYPDYVSHSPAPTGLKAFYTLLEEHAQVKTWKKPAVFLPFLEENQLMIMVEPHQAFAPEIMDQWIQWMEAGNRIWLVTENPEPFFSLSRVDTDHPKGYPVSILGPTDRAYVHRAYIGEVASDIRLRPEPNDRTLLEDKKGVLALSRAYGKGELMVLITPDWLTNQSILEYDHLTMILPFLERADTPVIWFNEYIHGYESGPAMLEAYPPWFLLLMAQVALILVMWLWMKGKRFGPVETPRAWSVRFGDERLRALAAWYERGRFYKEALAAQAEHLRQLIQKKWGVPEHLETPRWVEAVTRRFPPDRKSQWKRDIETLAITMQAEKISHRDFLKWSGRLDEMRKEVEQDESINL
ncbi:MAG: DUF4350 domain-containing protein [Bacillaceae bacterium]|nr:DUF4350 domain-containing protein [Bacillaceae bacterium]